MLNFLSENMVVLTLSALALVILLAIVFLLKVAIKHGNQATAGALPASATPTIQISSLKQSFRRAVELIENNLAERSERYNLSWTLVINGVGTEDLPVSASGLQSALSSDSAMVWAGVFMTRAWLFSCKPVSWETPITRAPRACGMSF